METQVRRPAGRPQRRHGAVFRAGAAAWASLPFRAAVTAGAVLLLLRSVDLTQLRVLAAHADPGLGLLALGLACVAQLALLVQWGLLLPVHPALSRRRLGHLFLRATAAGQVLPTGIGGDALRVVEVGRSVGYATAVGSLAASRVVNMLAVALWAVAGSLAAGWSGGVAVPLVAAGALLLVMTLALLGLAADRLGGNPPGRLATGRRILADTACALAAYRAQPARLLVALALSLAGWGVALAALVLFASALNLGVSWSLFAVAVPAAQVVALLPVTINGFGLREVVVVRLLGMGHVGAAAGSAAAVFVDIQVVPLAVAGMVLLLMRRRSVVAGRAAGQEAAEASAEGPVLFGRATRGPGAGVAADLAVVTGDVIRL